MADGPLATYRALVADGEIRPDPVQALAAEQLQLLAMRLHAYTPPKDGDFFSFFAVKKGPAPKGLYMFGGVGRGKTMLMDLFYDSVTFSPRRRVHFHEFMSDIHARIKDVRKAHDGDPIAIVAQTIVDGARLLCLDEMQITDITDAMILGRLFEAMFALDVIVVTTSNTAPGDLYKDGLNRALFLPFIEMIEERMDVLHLESPTDYRLDRLQGAPVYYTPLGPDAARAMNNIWQRLTQGRISNPSAIEVKGRRIVVPQTVSGIARFGFDALCAQPLGAEDYLTLARTFHTLFVQDVPVMGPDQRNEARRFITLIDTLYDAGICLIISADAEPAKLYPGGDGSTAFQRTISRLMEMRSRDYLSEHFSMK